MSLVLAQLPVDAPEVVFERLSTDSQLSGGGNVGLVDTVRPEGSLLPFC